MKNNLPPHFMIKRVALLVIALSLVFVAACNETTLEIPSNKITAQFTVIVTDEDVDQALIYGNMMSLNPNGNPLPFLEVTESEPLISYVAGVPYLLSMLGKNTKVGQYYTMYQTADKLLLTRADKMGTNSAAMINKPNYGDEIIVDFQRANGEILSSNGFVHNIPVVTAPIAGSVVPKSQKEITVSWDLDAVQQNSTVSVESYVRCALFQELGAGDGIEDNWHHLTEKGGFTITKTGNENSITLQRSDILMGITPEQGVDRCLAIVSLTSIVAGNINPAFRQAPLMKSFFSVHHQAKRVIYYIDI